MKNITLFLDTKKLYKNIILGERDLQSESLSLLTSLKIAKGRDYQIIDHTGNDLLTNTKLTYILTGTQNRLYINYITKENAAPSIQELAPIAYVTEREIFEFFGIFFTQASDLRRLLTDYSLIGNPFKKAFPLVGFLEIKYSSKKSLYQKQILLLQEIRDFHKKSSWT